MPEKFAGTVFTEVHHALLFGWIGRAVCETAGDEVGTDMLRIAVRRYGQERGRRMALRATANGHALSMAAYFAYGEWKASPPEALPPGCSAWTQQAQWVEKAPTDRERSELVTRCPWNEAWKANGLLAYGQLYCQEIDAALVSGFNLALPSRTGVPPLLAARTVAVDVLATLSSGAAACEFVFRDASLTQPDRLIAGQEADIQPGQSAAMPWEYHAGHLFATLEKVNVAQLGDAGRAAVQAGLAEFARHFGQPAAETILAYRGVDFDLLPEKKIDH